MATSWTEKDVMEHAKELKSPYASIVNKQPLPSPGGVLEAIRARANGKLKRPEGIEKEIEPTRAV